MQQQQQQQHVERVYIGIMCFQVWEEELIKNRNANKGKKDRRANDIILWLVKH